MYMTLKCPPRLPHHDLTALVNCLQQYAPDDVQYQKILTQIVRQVTPKLWRENTPYYADALQQTWLYFCKNVRDRYDPNVASLATWLNAYLKWRLRDLHNLALQEHMRHCSLEGDRKTGRCAIELPDHRSTSDAKPLTLRRVCQWVQTDASGDLRHTHIKNHPEINCQVLILDRLVNGLTWHDLSQKFGVKRSTLASFYYRQCLKQLRQFCESEGYV